MKSALISSDKESTNDYEDVVKATKQASLRTLPPLKPIKTLKTYGITGLGKRSVSEVNECVDTPTPRRFQDVLQMGQGSEFIPRKSFRFYCIPRSTSTLLSGLS